MNRLLIEREISIGYSTGEVDVTAWIKAWGLVEAIEKADNRLSALMIENGISDMKDIPKEAPPYIVGLMKAYEEFLTRHCMDSRVFEKGKK